MNTKTQTPQRIAIIGAGLGGMAAAWDLRRAGHEVTIFEASDQVGGLATGFRQPHWEWSVEKFYHHWFQSDGHMLGLMDELGLREKAFFPRPFTVLYDNGKWYPFDSILAALKFPGLGFGINKIRFGLVGLHLRLTNNWRGLEKHTAHDWMQRWAGRAVYEKMWQPLLIGKFGPYYKAVNMAWMWARLKARTTRLGTYIGGFQQFCDDFAERLRALGVVIELGNRAAGIQAGDSGLKVGKFAGSEAEPSNLSTFDQVLVTTSPTLMTRLAPDLPADYLAGLTNLKSMGAVVMVLSLKHSLSPEGYYWFNIPKDAGFPFLAVVEHTNFVSKEHFAGEHIIYCGDYLTTDHENFNLDKDGLLELFLPALQKFNPDFRPEWVNESWLFKAAYAQPVPLVNHSQNIPDIETPIAGLYFASMSQVYPWDRGTNFAVEIGRRAARKMMSQPPGASV